MVTEPASVYIVLCESRLDNQILAVFATQQEARDEMDHWAIEDPDGIYAYGHYEIGWNARSEGRRYRLSPIQYTENDISHGE